jgi:hypothetical protein
VAAPIRKVAPNTFSLDKVATDIQAAAQFIAEVESGPIHDSLSAFGTVVSSTAPQSLHRATNARAEIRRVSGLK